MWQTALCGSLAGALLLAAPTIAAAQDECGVVVAGKVDCGGLGTPVTGGITYIVTPVPPQDLTVALGDNQVVQSSSDVAPALQVVNPGGAVSVTGQTATLSTYGVNAPGLVAVSPQDLTVALGSITTASAQSPGVLAIGGGNVSVSVNSVTTAGDLSDGVYAMRSNTTTGDLNVFGGVIQTSGYASEAIFAHNAGGNVTVSGGFMHTTGYAAYGVDAEAKGDINVNISRVSTEGDYSIGILNRSDAGNIDVYAFYLTTTGNRAYGIVADTNTGNVTINAGSISTSGVGANGVNVISMGSEVNVNVGAVTASHSGAGVQVIDGGYVYGVGMLGYDGHATVTVGKIDVAGNYASGVYVTAGTTDLTINGDVTAIGHATGGVDARSIGAGGVRVHNNGNIYAGGAGIEAIGLRGPVLIDGTGTVTTNGDGYAHGIVGGTVGNDVTIIQSAVRAAGARSSAVRASISAFPDEPYAPTHNANVTLGDVSIASDYGFGVWVENDTHDGQANVTVTGTLSADGFAAQGLKLIAGDAATATVNIHDLSTTGAYGTGLNIKAGNAILNITGTAATGGDNAIGVAMTGDTLAVNNAGTVATAGKASHGVYVYGSSVTVANSGLITTSGQGADGVIALGTHDLTVTSSDIEVSGAGSVGLLALGDALSLTTGKTLSYSATAIGATAMTSADLRITGATAGGYNGLVVTAPTVSVAVAKDGFVGGGVNGMVVTAAGPAAGSSASNAPVSITIANAGTILGYSGNAIQVLQGVAKVTNSGTVEGSVVFAGGADSFENTGTFAALGASDFGAGNDVFHNTGVVSVGAGATAGQSASLANLELFSNDGTVDLHNGHTGDVLSVSGTFKGGTGSKLLMDIAPGAADQLVVGGTATGETLITLEGPTARTSVLGNPVLLIKAGAGSDEDAFAVANPDIGMIHYGLKYVEGTGFGLVPEAGGPVWHALHLSEGAEGLWMQSADAWSAQMTSLRDLPGTGDLPQGQVWTQVYGQSTTHRGDGTTDFDIKSKQDASGVQFGAEVVRREPTGDRFAFGLTGGYTEASSVFDASMEKGDTRSVNVGAYLSLRHGPYFFDALASAAQQSFALSDPVNGFNDTFNSTTLGLKAEWGMHLGGGFLSYEPVVSLGYARAGCSNLQALGQTLQFDTTETLRGALGLRLSGQVHFSGGSSLVYHAKVAATHDFLGENGVKFYSGEFVQHIGDDDRESFGRVIDLGVSYQTAHGMTFDASAEGDYGKSVSSVGGRLGVRFRF